MQVRIDREECIGCAACWADCPEFYEENPDDSLSQVLEEYRIRGDPGKGKVPEELQDCAQDAADNCPVQVIHVER